MTHCQQLIVIWLVSEHIQEIILGFDWLKENGVRRDFSKNWIDLGGRGYPLRGGSSGNWCCGVILQKTVTAPVRCELDVPTKLVYRDRDSAVVVDVPACMIEPDRLALRILA